MLLRPDFTVPIVRLHMEAGAAPARYVYCGPVWRRQEAGSDRPREYLQAGLEIFDAGDPAATDAEVLGADRRGARPGAGRLRHRRHGAGARGDRRARDQRRRARRRCAATSGGPPGSTRCSSRFGAGHAAAAAARGRLLAAAAEGRVPELIAAAGAPVGPARRRRGRRPRRAAGRRGGRAAARSGATSRGSRRCWRCEAPALQALARLRELARATCRGSRRRSTASRRGSTPWRRAGSTRHGCRSRRASGAPRSNTTTASCSAPCARGRPDLPPIASGGRYDALTRALGRGRGIPAVGGIIRPEALVALMRLKLGVPSKGRLQDDTIAWFGARGVDRGAERRGARVPRHACAASRASSSSCSRPPRSRASWPPAGCTSA